MSNRFHASFKQVGDELQGKVVSAGSPAFTLECLAEIVTGISQQTGISRAEIVRDLYSLVSGKVT